MDIETPPEFARACRNLVQGLGAASAEELVQHALIGVDREDAHAIRTFLDDFLSKSYGADELQDFWWSVPSDIVFDKGEGVQTFLKAMREALGKPPYLEGT